MGVVLGGGLPAVGSGWARGSSWGGVLDDALDLSTEGLSIGLGFSLDFGIGYGSGWGEC